MLTRLSTLRGTALHATDGRVGKVLDAYLDHGPWTVRYLLVSLQNRKPVQNRLIAPVSLDGVDAQYNFVTTNLNSQQLARSPAVNPNKPVSRRFEEALVNHFGWPIYWLGQIASTYGQNARSEPKAEQGGPVPANVFGSQDIVGFRIQGPQGNNFYVKDLVVNLNSWHVEYVTAGSSYWLNNETAMLSTDSIRRLQWSEKTVEVKSGAHHLMNCDFPRAPTGASIL